MASGSPTCCLTWADQHLTDTGRHTTPTTLHWQILAILTEVCSPYENLILLWDGSLECSEHEVLFRWPECSQVCWQLPVEGSLDTQTPRLANTGGSVTESNILAAWMIELILARGIRVSYQCSTASTGPASCSHRKTFMALKAWSMMVIVCQMLSRRTKNPLYSINI